jgi:hypothetical protein
MRSEIVMCELGLCHKPITGLEKPDCFGSVTGHVTQKWKIFPEMQP